jgi:hypothetical protein
VLDCGLSQEQGARNDGEKDTKGEPKGYLWDDARPVVVDDAFEHGIKLLMNDE